jgi:hypothetical protein
MRFPLCMMVALSACIPLESGIDNTRIEGDVQLLPVRTEEVRDRVNQNLDEAVVLPGVAVAALLVEGVLTESAVDADGEPAGDVDVYELTTRSDLADYVLPLDFGTGTARVELFDLDQDGGGLGGTLQILASVDITGAGSIAFPVPPAPATTTSTSSTSTSSYTSYTSTSTTGLSGPGMAAGIRYGLRISGLSGAADAPYSFVLPPLSPDTTQILVGAWLEDTIETRENLVAGTSAVSWTGGTADEDWVWTGRYSMFLVRALEYETNADGDKVVVGADEEVGEVYVFAGDWANLNQGLPAGTWYSGTPQHVVLDGEPSSLLASDAVVYEADGPLVLDTFAPIVVGLDVEEVEPSGAVVDYDSFTIVPAEGVFSDVGALSGPGFVDIFRGHIDIAAGVGYESHDSDAWAFTVLEPSLLFMTMSWDSDADLDVIAFDEAGEAVDWAASVSNPEVGGGYWIFEPGIQYYLVVAGYEGTEGSSPAYEVSLEAASP